MSVRYTESQFMEAVLSICPMATIREDQEGQLVIYTDMALTDEGVTDFEDLDV